MSDGYWKTHFCIASSSLRVQFNLLYALQTNHISEYVIAIRSNNCWMFWCQIELPLLHMTSSRNQSTYFLAVSPLPSLLGLLCICV